MPSSGWGEYAWYLIPTLDWLSMNPNLFKKMRIVVKPTENLSEIFVDYLG